MTHEELVERVAERLSRDCLVQYSRMRDAHKNQYRKQAREAIRIIGGAILRDANRLEKTLNERLAKDPTARQKATNLFTRVGVRAATMSVQSLTQGNKT